MRNGAAKRLPPKPLNRRRLIERRHTVNYGLPFGGWLLQRPDSHGGVIRITVLARDNAYLGATAPKAAASRGGIMAKEIPYSKIDPRELQDLEAEFGRTLTPEMAQCLIRYRINRDAIELMLRNGSGAGALSAAGFSEMHIEIGPAPNPTPKTENASSEKEGEEEKRSARQPAHGARPGRSGAARKAVA